MNVQRLICLAVLTSVAAMNAVAADWRALERPDRKQIDILYKDQLFTSWCYWDGQMKPIIHPLRSPKGALLTRSFPHLPVAGERVDHPQHLSSWFSHGNVNGVDFWNNYNSPTMGRTVQRSVDSIRSTASGVELRVSMDWIMPDGRKILDEKDRIVFGGSGDIRTIDRIVELRAQNEPVIFGDTKNGGFGMRIARALEEPATEAVVLTGADGKPRPAPVMENAGPGGTYRNAEGLTGEKNAWGKRSRWMSLEGIVAGEPVTIAIFDHPANSTFPTRWHARGYGLFAVNPFGKKEFSNGAEVSDFRIEPGRTATFRYRILLGSGLLTPEQTEEQYSRFLRAVCSCE